MENKFYDSFMMYATNIMSEFGFNFKKKDMTFYQISEKYVFNVIFANTKKESISFRYLINNENFEKLFKDITGFTVGYGLIDLITSMAFLDWPDSDYVGTIYFKDAVPWHTRAITLEQAEYELERLVTGHMLPWFDKYKNLVNIRDIFRNTFEKYDTKRNVNFSPAAGTNPGGAFIMFYEDVILSRLIGDDLRPAQVIYDEYYREAYYKYWSKNDDSGVSLMEQERVKNHFEILPSIIEKIEAITNAQWAEYRILTGIGVEHDG
ncbi:MAG: hypothetical protein LBQ60_11945 [Bacteroidales bacterium]|jgi:hypothetical protein|nr:hypothetical protein [Bacteroidales bacterium]